MAKPEDRIELLQGTLDMIILRTLLLGPAHGHEIARHIQRTTDDLLQVEHGSLYPALHRLERRGWVSARWEKARDRNREFKYYRLTTAGRRQLVREQSKWRQLAGAIARLLGSQRRIRHEIFLVRVRTRLVQPQAPAAARGRSASRIAHPSGTRRGRAE